MKETASTVAKITKITIRKSLTISVLFALMLLALTGCRGPASAGDAFSCEKPDSKGLQDPGFPVSAGGSLADFDWAFNPSKYDSSSEVLFENPIAAGGIWEMVVWRRLKKGGAEKDLYWINIELEDATGKLADIDPDIYASLAFKSSEEAKNAGLSGSDTSARLLEALMAGDGSVGAYVTVYLAGIEDNDGNWTSVSANPVQLEGKYYPDHMYLKVEDQKGNEFTANTFVSNKDEQHAVGGYTPASNEPGLLGLTYLYRKVR